MKRLASWSRYLKPYLPPANAENLRAIFPGAETRAEQPRSAIRSVRRLHESGARVLAETDAPNPGTAFGVSVHGELALLVGAGLTPTEALAAATAATADAFRMHDRGRIAPGLRADLLLVEGDPTRDIEVTRRIRRVWRGGHPIARPPVEDGGAPGAEASHEIPANGWISRFDDRTATLGQGWMESTDRIAGGSSTVGFDVVDDDLGEGRHLRIAGEVAPGAAVRPGRRHARARRAADGARRPVRLERDRLPGSRRDGSSCGSTTSG